MIATVAFLPAQIIALFCTFFVIWKVCFYHLYVKKSSCQTCTVKDVGGPGVWTKKWCLIYQMWAFFLFNICLSFQKFGKRRSYNILKVWLLEEPYRGVWSLIAENSIPFKNLLLVQFSRYLLEILERGTFNHCAGNDWPQI